MRILAVVFLLMPLHAQAADGVIDRVVDEFALPAVAAFAERTKALNEAAKSNCAAEHPALRAAWNAAMDAWLGIQDLRFGPLEDAARRQAIAYWPDTRGHRERALSRILSGQDPILTTPDRYNQEPVSARGLYAIETMLYDPDFNHYGPSDPGCLLVRAASADLAAIAAEVHNEWQNEFADVMRTAGEPSNTRFLDSTEARQAVFTALLTSIQFDVLERLGLPLGTFDKPRPLRAESRLSGRSQRNLELSLAGHDRLARALVPDAAANVVTREDFERIGWMAAELDDPDFSGVENPIRRFRLEALQSAFALLRSEMNRELSAALGVTMGLNALDGD